MAGILSASLLALTLTVSGTTLLVPAHAVAEVAATSNDGRQVQDLSSAAWVFKFGDPQAAEKEQFDDSSWEHVTVPHTWNRLGAYSTIRPADTNKAQGIGWYRLHIKAPIAKRTQRQYLDFGAVGAIADVWVNGIHVGQHRGAFARFRFDVTAQWRPGAENLVVVKADNSKPSPKSTTADVLPIAGDFFIYGGIYRGVSLITTESASIDLLDFGGPGIYAEATSISPEQAKVRVLARLRNSQKTSRRLIVKTTIHTADGIEVARSARKVTLPNGQSEETASLNIAKPHLWNGVADPYMYSVSVELVDGKTVLDRVVQPLGLRTFRFDANEGFSLNGQHVALHGVSRHQDRQDKGWALSAEDHKEDMALIQEMGANTIRLAHYQHADEWVSDADEAGMIAWAEVPYVSASSFDATNPTPGLVANAEQQTQELIRQQFNHPSIVMWSIGNEVNATGLYLNGGKPVHTLALLQRLAALAKAEDPSRTTTFADCCEDTPISMKAPEPLAGSAETIGYNRYFGWYYGKVSDIGPELDKLHQKHPSLPMALTEYGAGGSLSQLSDNPEGGSITAVGRVQPEAFESWYHQKAWQQLKSRKYLYATWVWNMFDFASDMRSEGDAVDLNNKGLVAYDHKTRKDAFWFYKAAWSKEPVLALTGKRYVDRANPVMTIQAYSNATRAKLKINGIDRGEVSCDDYVCVWPNVTLSPGANLAEVSASVGGKNISDQANWNAPDLAGGIHIKAGDILVRTINKVRWGSDNFFDGGQTVSTQTSLFETRAFKPDAPSSKAIYTSWRMGDAFSYTIPIPNGRYSVTIYTLDPGKGTTPETRMSVCANNQSAIPPFSVLQEAGEVQRGIAKTFSVNVASGVLKLDFAGQNGPAVVSAIEIRP